MLRFANFMPGPRRNATPRKGKHSDRELQGGVRPGSSLSDDPWRPRRQTGACDVLIFPTEALAPAL